MLNPLEINLLTLKSEQKWKLLTTLSLSIEVINLYFTWRGW